MKKPGRLETGRLKTACPNISDVIAFECSNPIECRINSCLRKVKYNLYNMFRNQFFLNKNLNTVVGGFAINLNFRILSAIPTDMYAQKISIAYKVDCSNVPLKPCQLWKYFLQAIQVPSNRTQQTDVKLSPKLQLQHYQNRAPI